MNFRSNRRLLRGISALILLLLQLIILPESGQSAYAATSVSPRAIESIDVRTDPRSAPSVVSSLVLASFSQIDLYSNIETIGVVVSGANLPKTAQLMYRQSSDPNWHSGHHLVRIDDGRLVGSLFGLLPGTTYNIRVLDGSTEISGTATTQPDELQFTPAVIVHVNDDASPGGDGSAAAPFRTIQEGVNHASPGTQVLVADGVYRESVSFPASGSGGNWIQVKAAGNGAILDGSQSADGLTWKSVDGKNNLWFTKIAASTAYLARDQKRFYQYDDYSGLMQARGHNGVPMNEGWYFESLKLYVRSPGNPSNHTWQIAVMNQAFNVTGKDWIWIEGFEMRFYGIGDGCGVCMKDASHVVVRKNRIHNLQKGVFFEWTGGQDRGNDTRIEYNEIYDPSVNEWPWAAVKSTSMEGTAIIVRGHIGAIVRGNEVHHFFNGIYTGSSAALENPGIAFDADIYNNYIHHLSDDALEPEGTCINVRFRNNTIDSVFVGASFAPVTQGPTWMMRSTISNYTGRSIKWDRNSDGVVLIYHNTSWTNSQSSNGMDLISPVFNAVMRNNIFQNRAFGFEEVPTGSSGHDWNNDNWYTSRSGPHFKWENIEYAALAGLCAATGLECSGYEDPPGLTDPASGNFTLIPTSPNIDRGVVIPGINDNFAGSAPDVGAFELAFDPPPTVRSSTLADANPTNAATVNFTVTFSEAVTGVDINPPFNDFALNADPGVTGAVIESVTPDSGTIYTVRVNTGSGSGLLRLDVVDDNSIADSASNSLGGVGAGNGNFNSGESYTIVKNLPIVTGIVRIDPDPANTATVHFSVTFSEVVSGVDAADFLTQVTGAISGSSVNEVTGSGTTYSVTVNTGTGDGTLRLDLVDNDSILNETNIPLGGPGAGNGNFANGEAYTIHEAAPTGPSVTSSTRLDADPTTAPTVRFSVIFSEPVSGVDSGDFTLTSGGISGASVIGVNGSGNAYTVTIGTGTGNGTLRLDVLDNDSILNASSISLGGAGTGNGSFTTGQFYTVNKSVVILTKSFTSNGGNDGWLLESSETSNRGGSGNSNAATFNLGDDAKDRQYRALLHFPTSALPDNAVITLVILSIKRQGSTGTDPFTTHQNINLDIRSGYFGSSGLFGINSLDLTDFQASASKNAAGTINNNPVSGWYWAALDGTSFQFVNRGGVTQFRLNFQIDDNDDLGADFLQFYSGNYKVLSDRPQLQIDYYVPR